MFWLMYHHLEPVRNLSCDILDFLHNLLRGVNAEEHRQYKLVRQATTTQNQIYILRSLCAERLDFTPFATVLQAVFCQKGTQNAHLRPCFYTKEGNCAFLPIAQLKEDFAWALITEAIAFRQLSNGQARPEGKEKCRILQNGLLRLRHP